MDKRAENAVFMTMLRNQMQEHFNLNELKILCFDLRIDMESLSGNNLQQLVIEIIQYMLRRDRLDQLVQQLKSERPTIDWELLKASLAESLSPSMTTWGTIYDSEPIYMWHTNKDVLYYMEMRMKTVKKSVKLAHFNRRVTPESADTYKPYKDARFQAIRNPNILFDQLMILTEKRLKEACDFLNSPETAGHYSVGYVLEEQLVIPAFTFTIFDDEEVVFRAPNKVIEYSPYVGTKNESDVGICGKHFDIAREASTKLERNQNFEQLKAML